MSDRSAIQWTEATWNPTTGCTKVSPGCDNCYAERLHNRFHGAGSFDTVTRSDEKVLLPLRWKKPRRIFVNSMSDLFHDDVPEAFIAHVFSVMARTPQHTYQVLTKRHGRMRSLLNRPSFRNNVRAWSTQWPLSNVWLGVSVEDQRWAEIRIPALLDTPAAVRWISAEPLLGPIDLTRLAILRPQAPYGPGVHLNALTGHVAESDDILPVHLDWVVVGGESGPKARPMRPDWARSLRDQCTATRVPFFFKQWGSYRWVGHSSWDDATQCWVDDGIEPQRVTKHLAGRELDGRTWDEYPHIPAADAGIPAFIPGQQTIPTGDPE